MNTQSNTQNAVLIDQYGEAKLLKSVKRELKSSLEPGEVKIQIHYSGVNFADIVMRLGFYKDAPPKPFVPGYEYSGVITEVGSQVNDLKVGDHVLGGTRFGGYVDQIVVPSWQAVKIPNGMNLQEAAAVPVNFITAFIALEEMGRIRKGDKILLDCASGGVGVIAMQMAAKVGAQVVGLTSTPAKKSFIESYGAKAYTHEEFKTSGETDFDFILNSSGGSTLKYHYTLLGKAGKLCCIGMQEGTKGGKRSILRFLLTALKMPRFSMINLTMNSKMVSGFNALKFFEDEKWMKKVMKELSQVDLKPHIGKVFDATNVTAAHECLENKQAKGKVLIQWHHQ